MAILFRVFAGLGLWLIGEFVVFSLVAQQIGVDGAIIATLLTSLAGILLLRRLGVSARQKIVEIVNSRGQISFLSPQKMGAGLSAALGSLLLILPGFLTDVVGIFLLVRSGWNWHHAAPARFGHAASRGTSTVDLSPQDWRRLEEGERR